MLSRLLSDQFVDIHDFDYALNKPSFSIIEDLIAQKSKIPLCNIQDSRDESANKLSLRLKKLKRMDHLVFEERGATDLYVGWPFVKGKFSDGTLVRSAVMFFPVTLETSQQHWVLRLRKDVNLTMNKSLLLAYAYFNNLKANDQLLDRVFDDFDKESKGFRTDLYELFKEQNLEINFNQDNFQDTLAPFSSYTRADLERSERDGVIKMFPEAVLGLFPQAGSYLVPDYLELMANPLLKSMDQFFLERNLDEEVQEDHSYYRFLKRVKEDQTFTAFKMDAFQENAIKAIKKGNSVVVQGPPGTGKSQLICNLICDYIARGKNVLLVSQKRAALDVVFERLKEKQLADFIALLHDFKNDRKPIYEQIAGQVDKLESYKMMNNTLDSIQLERNFLKTSRRIDQIEEELEEFKAALFDESECGLSVKELYLTSDPGKPFVTLNQEYRHFHFDSISDFARTLASYCSYAGKFLRERYPWRKRKSFNGYGVNELKELRSILKEIPDYKEKLHTKAEQTIGRTIDFEDAAEITSNIDQIHSIINLMEEPSVFDGFVRLLEVRDDEVDLQWLSKLERTVVQSFKGVGPEVSLKSEELGRFQEVLERTIDARKGLIKWVRWKLFSKDKVFITRVLVANKLKSNKQGFKVLVEMIDNRLNLEHNITEIRAREAFHDFPISYRKIDIQNWFFYQKQAASAKSIYLQIRGLKDLVTPVRKEHVAFVKKLRDLLKMLDQLPDKLGHWMGRFDMAQLREIFAGHITIDELESTLNRDFDSLCEFDALEARLSSEEKRVIEKLTEESPESPEHWPEIFDNSIRHAWIDHIELKYPLLRAVSSQKFEQLQSELQQAVREKLKISNDIILLKARERVYKNVEYNRLNNRVTYRDLYHQVTKKRRIWPVRKLLANFPREIFDVVPCWMASPESVSAIFPMEKVFDLIIFDEASQCFAEKGLPAMYRGKQLVVAGDDKQLRPNDLYKVRWEEDNEEEIAALDFDSLLNLSNQYLMQVHLREHYRSKSLDLISFSNEHFYKNELKLLPDFEEINDKNPGISYIKTQGIWENNINHEEALKVCELVKEILQQTPEKEIGVVTFNAKQQLHVLDTLERFAIQHSFTIPDSLIVKNIENVQGDEKDIIIFSIVYAPDRLGRLNMMFGSLNAEGGENRLNVAVTRARERVYVVSSIMPQEMKVDHTKNDGPKLLKKYLEYAWEVSNGQFVTKEVKDDHFSPNWYLKTRIEEMGKTEWPQVSMDRSLPFVDLALREGDVYKGVVFTDDELYYNSISIKDTHVYAPFTLSSKKWKFQGIFSREYWQDRESVKDKVARLIGKSKI